MGGVRGGAMVFATAGLIAGCPLGAPVGAPPTDGFQNTSDPTNGDADYVGALACAQCHSTIAASHRLSGHANALAPVRGAPPDFPAEARGTIDAPPADTDWAELSWVVGGYLKGALLADANGFLLTTAGTGVATLWQAAGPVRGADSGYADFMPDRGDPLPLDFETFRRRATDPRPLDPAAPRFQEGRPGIRGTWTEPGVQCEACHGPGGRHFGASGAEVEIDRAAIYVDGSGADTCRTCHSAGFDPDDERLFTSDGLIDDFQQSAELRASGGHAAFACTVCHDPHRALAHDREAAIRNDCRACHGDQNMALHEGAVFERADGFREPLTCESCHMTYAVRRFAGADFGDGRSGDVRTHLFRIDTAGRPFGARLDSAGTLQRDAAGRAAITLDRVCLRCHNDDVDGLFTLSLERAAEIAPNLHKDFTLRPAADGASGVNR